MSSIDRYIAYQKRMIRHLTFEQKLFDQGKTGWAKRALERRVLVGNVRFERRYSSIQSVAIGRAQRLS
jgi:hypothetical protein